MLVSALPDRWKQVFLNAVQPFIDVSDGPAGRPIHPPATLPESPPQKPANQIARAAQAIQKAVSDGARSIDTDNKRYVQIDGNYYEYNPEGLYIVNGKKIFFKRERKP